MFTLAMKRVAMFSIAVILLISVVPKISAQEGGGSGLIISPTRNEIEVAPGSTQKIPVSLRNVSGVDITAKAEINDFTTDNKSGEPKIYPANEKKVANSVRNFLNGVTDVELKKDQKKDFEITISVPANAAPGAYYGVVRYSAVPLSGPQATDQNRVSLTASVGTLVLLTVPGDIKEQIQINSLNVERNVNNQVKAGGFFFNKPNQISLDVANKGNGFSKPFGRVTVSKGGKEVAAYELNNTDPRGNILPGSSRIFTDKLEGVGAPGKYTVTANVSHGSGGEVIPVKASFWYVPAWIFIVLGALLILLIVAAYVLYRKKFSSKFRKSKKR